MKEIELNPLDEHFARNISRLAGVEDDGSFFHAARLVCHLCADGHVCMDLADFAGQEFAFRYLDHEERVSLPDADEWIEALKRNPLVGGLNDKTPLILDDQRRRLYLFRYWRYERHLVRSFLKLAAADPFPPIAGDSALLMEQLFPPADGVEDQRQTARLVMENQLCIVTGGPGAGKTTTIVKIMALLLMENPEIRITLTAPTGKAASRLAESVAAGKEMLRDIIPQAVLEKISENTSTIHRLLKSRKNSIYFRHDASNPLPIDCLVLDEASMADMALMSKLLQALPDRCRLVLLGDPNQLSSVEAGAVFGDICSSDNNQLRGKIANLRTSRRFDPNKGIGKLSDLVLAENGKAAYDYLNSGQDGQVAWSSLPKPDALRSFVEEIALLRLKALFSVETIEDAFDCCKSFVILTALRNGPYGSVNLNLLIEEALIRRGLAPATAEWHRGKPILITRNDYSMELFNGDLGICFPDPATNRLNVYFEKSGGYRKLSPYRLPAYESVYALTVHKSQGSEFDEVMLILPDRESDILTKELIYTGITRARSRMQIFGNKRVFIDAVVRSCRRKSGLIEGLNEA